MRPSGAIPAVPGRPAKALKDPPNRIQELRIMRQLTQTQLADRCGWEDRQKVQKLEQGQVALKAADAMVLAKVLGVTVEQLQSQTGENDLTVPVVGFVGGGEKVEYFDDQAPIDWVEPPTGAGDTKAVIVRGASMQPRYYDGELLFFRKQAQGVPAEAIGLDCVVQVTSGPALVKRVFRGSREGLYRLRSVNGSDLEDVALDWASPVLWTKQRR